MAIIPNHLPQSRDDYDRLDARIGRLQTELDDAVDNGMAGWADKCRWQLRILRSVKDEYLAYVGKVGC